MKKKVMILFSLIIAMLVVLAVKDIFFTPLIIHVRSIEISTPKLSLASYGVQTDNIENTKVAVVELEFYNPSLIKSYSLVDLKVHELGGNESILGNIVDMGSESGLIGMIKPLGTRNCSNVTILLSNINEEYLLQEIEKTKFIATGIIFGKRQTISKPFRLCIKET